MTETVYQGKVLSFYQHYGFIQILNSGEQENVYISIADITPTEEVESKFLIPGEYVEFRLFVDGDKRSAKVLKGIHGGALLCENKYIRSTLLNYRRRMRRNHRATDATDATDATAVVVP